MTVYELEMHLEEARIKMAAGLSPVEAAGELFALIERIVIHLREEEIIKAETKGISPK